MSVCPVSPGLTTTAFAEYRSAGAALSLSPRGDMHTDIPPPPVSTGGGTLVSGGFATPGTRVIDLHDRRDPGPHREPRGRPASRGARRRKRRPRVPGRGDPGR